MDSLILKCGAKVRKKLITLANFMLINLNYGRNSNIPQCFRR